MASTSEIMNKLRSSKKSKYFRKSEESRAYQFLNKAESGSGAESESPDLKSGSGTESESPDLKSGSGTESEARDLKSGSGAESEAHDLKSGSGTESEAHDLKSGSGTESESSDLKSGSGAESESYDLKSGSGTESELPSSTNVGRLLAGVVDGKLSLREIKVYSCLLLEGKIEVQISGNNLAKKTNISRGTITQIVKSLIEKGYMEKIPSKGNMNVYKLI